MLNGTLYHKTFEEHGEIRKMKIQTLNMKKR